MRTFSKTFVNLPLSVLRTESGRIDGSMEYQRYVRARSLPAKTGSPLSARSRYSSAFKKDRHVFEALITIGVVSECPSIRLLHA